MPGHQRIASMHMNGRSADKRTKASFISRPRPCEANSWVRAAVVRLRVREPLLFSSSFFPRHLCTPSLSNISTTLDRSLITILRHRTTEPTFRFGSRTADREESRTKLHATSTTRSGSDNRAEVAGLNEYQGTINALRGNIDTLAQILQYIVTT